MRIEKCCRHLIMQHAVLNFMLMTKMDEKKSEKSNIYFSYPRIIVGAIQRHFSCFSVTCPRIDA